MNKVSNRKSVEMIAISGVLIAGLYAGFLAWTPAAYITNETGDKITNVEITYKTSSGDQVERHAEVLPGRTVRIRGNTNDLTIGSFECDSVHGRIQFPVAENITPTKKLRIGIRPDRSHSRTNSRFW